MPDNNEEVKDIQEAAPEVEAQPSEEKRRIKPVIEEVVGDTPGEVEPVEAHEHKAEVAEPETVEHNHDHGHEHSHEQEVHVHETKPEYGREETKSDIKLFVMVAVITALVVAALAGGIYVYLTGTKDNGVTPSPTPEVNIILDNSPEASPESSSSGNIKLSEYKVQVLNGSGKIGEAGKAKTLLEDAGFKVKTTGNAESFDFTDTIIQVKNSVSEDVLGKVENSLSSAYSVKTGDILTADSDFDIIITIGSK